MAFTDAARPLSYAAPDERVEYLKKVLLWTTGGLALSAITGLLTATAIYVAAAAGLGGIVLNQITSLVVIFGSYGIAHYLAPRLVFGNQKVLGFGVGAVFQGIAMGYLLFFAGMMSYELHGSPFTLAGSALALTGLTGFGMTAYVWTGPKNFSMLGAALSALFLPMLILMGVGVVFPSLFGGTMGIVLSAVFVVVSAGGLLYQINQVMHRLATNQHIEGAYLITMGLLVLYWNILTLLMRLNRR